MSGYILLPVVSLKKRHFWVALDIFYVLNIHLQRLFLLNNQE